MAKLFLVRHGKSEWNKLGLWTGWTDVDLVSEGIKAKLSKMCMREWYLILRAKSKLI